MATEDDDGACFSSSNGIELGFVEKITEYWKLQSKFFPSKVGGKPAWLDLKNLPTPSELECDYCKDPCVFLLQIYSPDDDPRCFHRTIFLFICKNPECSRTNERGNFKVFRNQLERQNEFYSFNPPNENDSSEVPNTFVTLCSLCGCLGTKKCSRCRKISYCSKKHQAIHWKSNHKANCVEVGLSDVGNSNSSQNTAVSSPPSPFLFKEYELVTEAEDFVDNEEEKSEATRMKEYQEFVLQSRSDEASSSSEIDKPTNIRDLEELASHEVDKVFSKFRKRIQIEPEQVLRYHKQGEPLWVSSEKIPLPNEIPPCSCGASRRFEFQIMPQLLNYLDIDQTDKSIDWGTLAIYTCSENCSEGTTAYHAEFIWKQDFVL